MNKVTSNNDLVKTGDIWCINIDNSKKLIEVKIISVGKICVKFEIYNKNDGEHYNLVYRKSDIEFIEMLP